MITVEEDPRRGGHVLSLRWGTSLPGQSKWSGAAVTHTPECNPGLGTFRDPAHIIQDTLKEEPEARTQVVSQGSNGRTWKQRGCEAARRKHRPRAQC